MKLTSIVREILNEAVVSSPLQIVRRAIGAMGKVAPAAEDALLRSIKKAEGNIRPNLTLDEIRDIDSDLVTKAIKSPEFSVYRPLIAKKLYSGAKKSTIDDIVGRLERKEITPKQSVVELNNAGIPPSLQKEVRELSKTVSGGNPRPIPNNTPTPPNPNNIPAPPSQAPPEEIGATKQFLQGLKLSALDYLKKIPKIKNRMSKIYFQQLEPLNNLKDRFHKIMGEIEPKIMGDGDFEINDQLKELNVILSQFAEKRNVQQKLVWEEWKGVLSPELQSKIGKFENSKFKEFYTYFEKTVSAETKSEPPTLTYSKIEAAKKLFQPGNKGFWRNLDQFRRRLGNIFLFLDPRTFSEINDTLARYGTARGVGKELGDKILATVVFWPTILAAGQTVLDFTENMSGIDIPMADDEYVSELEPYVGDSIGGFVWDNLVNILQVWGHNYLIKAGFAGEELTSLLGWSPAMYGLSLTFLGGKKRNMTQEELKTNLEQAKKDVEKSKVEIKDTLSKEPDLFDSLKKYLPNDFFNDETQPIKPTPENNTKKVAPSIPKKVAPSIE
jgi:hypothetical protein